MPKLTSHSNCKQSNLEVERASEQGSDLMYIFLGFLSSIQLFLEQSSVFLGSHAEDGKRGSHEPCTLPDLKGL